MCGFLTVGSKELEIDVFDEALGKIEGRGPDMIETSRLFDKTFGFNRLAIMDLSEKGMQPFSMIILLWYVMEKSITIQN